jgi:hypothetical protein
VVSVLVKDQRRSAAMAIGFKSYLGIDDFDEKITLTLGE